MPTAAWPGPATVAEAAKLQRTNDAHRVSAEPWRAQLRLSDELRRAWLSIPKRGGDILPPYLVDVVVANPGFFAIFRVRPRFLVDGTMLHGKAERIVVTERRRLR